MIADLLLFPPFLSALLLIGFGAAGFFLPHHLRAVGAGFLLRFALTSGFILVAGWITAWMVAPSWGAKDGHGGMELIQREDYMLFAWMLACGVAWIMGVCMRILTNRLADT